jgi:hypothetical protein
MLGISGICERLGIWEEKHTSPAGYCDDVIYSRNRNMWSDKGFYLTCECVCMKRKQD